MTSIVVQHSVEVVGTAVFFVDFAVVDHVAGLDAVVWETADAGLVCAVFVADTVACNEVDVGADVVLECTAVYTAQGAPVCCTLGNAAVVFG